MNPEKPPENCKCRDQDCPVNGECERRGVIYQCSVKETNSGKVETYVGLTENSFKDRITKHRKSIRDRNYHKNSLSNHIWNLKDQNIDHEISWKILEPAQPYSPASKICNLCVREIYFILYHRKMASLNKRKEFFRYCLHKGKYFIENH